MSEDVTLLKPRVTSSANEYETIRATLPTSASRKIGNPRLGPESTIASSSADWIAGESTRVLDQIGAGGMGEVYSAEQVALGRNVVKVAPASVVREQVKQTIGVFQQLSLKAIFQVLGFLFLLGLALVLVGTYIQRKSRQILD